MGVTFNPFFNFPIFPQLQDSDRVDFAAFMSIYNTSFNMTLFTLLNIFLNLDIQMNAFLKGEFQLTFL